jgi:TolB-like protein/Flp pilus assembly protein TadD
MSDPLARLGAALADRYAVEGELGRGGMATVYRAEDVKHRRAVAIKVLRPDLAAALGPERFLREIEIAASLSHPHILPLFDSGEAGGFLYYVMPLVEGESLRERLERERQLPIEDALALTREVADALGAAHGRGIVHRDIKPENILLHGGHAVVSDFGIARAVSAAGGTSLTETGIAVGTPAYMSPEQAAGERELDGRSDLYSLACVTYEMLLGHPPFSGISAHEILARHTSDPLPPLRTVRGTVPLAVERALERALAKIPADRYPTVQQFSAALAAPTVGSDVTPRRRPSAPVLIGAGMAAIALVLAALAVPRLLHRTPAAEREPTVVVLPPRRPDTTAQDWFTDGVTGEVSNRLTQISGLRVIGPQSAAQYASSGKSLREFGEEVHAQYALALSFEYDQEPTGPRRVKVSPQLVRIADGQQVWGDRYIDTLTGGQTFDTEARIAEQVGQALGVTLLADERRALHTPSTQVADAHEAYLRGTRYLRGLPRDVPATAAERLAAIAEFQRAVALDSTFAEAHAMLAIQYARRARTDSALAPARTHAERAVTLRPDLALAHYARAEVAFASGDWTRARTEAAVADQLGHNAAELLEATASLHASLADYESMARNFGRAAVLDPLSPATALTLGVAYFALHRNEEALASFDRAAELDSTASGPYTYKAWLELSWHGSTERASAAIQEAVRRLGRSAGFTSGFLWTYWWASRLLARDPWFRTALESVSLARDGIDSTQYYEHLAGLYEGLGQRTRARAYWDSTARVVEPRLRVVGILPRTEASLRADLAMSAAGRGDRRRALEEANRAVRLTPDEQLNVYVLGLVYAELGDADSAAAQFERAIVVPGWVTPAFLSLDPTFEPLKRNPRFRRLFQTAPPRPGS